MNKLLIQTPEFSSTYYLHGPLHRFYIDKRPAYIEALDYVHTEFHKNCSLSDNFSQNILCKYIFHFYIYQSFHHIFFDNLKYVKEIT